MISADERQTLTMRAPDALDAYAYMAAGRHQAASRARRPYADTEPALYRAEDAMRAAINDRASARTAARAERHKARTQTTIKRLLFLLVGLALAIMAGEGTVGFLVSESGHVPAVVRMVPARACAMVIVKC